MKLKGLFDTLRKKLSESLGIVANIVFLVYASETAKSYMMKTYFWDMKGEIMQQLIQFDHALKKIMVQGMSFNFSRKKFKVTFVTFFHLKRINKPKAEI